MIFWVGTDFEFKTLIKTGLPISQNGYLYVYTSNESPVDVFFDNLQVTHVRGPLLEETHYYPFGLTMAGISTYASGCLKNKKKFIGQELDESFGLNWYQFRWRNHDAQLGRFIEVDPLADKYPYNSTYAYSENKVINGFDLEGLEFFAINPGWLNIALESNNVVTRGPFLENVVKTGSDIGTKTAEVGNKVPKIEDHHLIPKELKDNPIVELAREGGFKFEGKENKIGLEKFQRATGEGQHGNHPKYTSEVARRIADFQRDNPNATPKEAVEFARNLVKDLKEKITNNQGTKVNDLFKQSNLPAQDGTLVAPKVRPIINQKTTAKDPCNGAPGCI